MVRFSNNLLIDAGQLFGPSGSVLADCGVGVEPARAGTDFEAVQKRINRVIGNV